MNAFELYHAQQLQQMQTAERLRSEAVKVIGTPLIIPQVAGINTEGWEQALSEAIQAAERDMMELQGDWFDQPACLEPVK